MKKLLLAVALITLGTAPAIAEEKVVLDPKETPAEVVATVERDVVIDVAGMVCDFCAQSIQKVFGKQDSVVATSVDLDAGQVIVDLKDGAELSDEKIDEMITFSGYEVTKITR